MNLKTTFFIILVTLGVMAVSSATESEAQDAANSNRFEALIFHPGTKSGEPILLNLFQTLEKSGSISEYHVDVDSVICGDGQCEIITVRLVWDPLGAFLRYEFPEGGNLTKRGHENFTAEDHKKLLGILQDPESLLSDVAASDVVHPGVAQTGEEIDGTSGATLLSDKSAIVSGAVYTCYTLWHWVNSDLQLEIQSITTETIHNDQLLIYLRDSNPKRAKFAIEQLSKKGIQDEATRTAIHELTLNGSIELASAGIGYFQSLGAAGYYKAISKLFEQGSSKKQVLYLSSMASTDLPAPDGFYDVLSSILPMLGSYYEVHLLLNLMTEYNYDSPIVVSNALPLLTNKSFLIGRRSYNFLKDRELEEPQQTQVEAFKIKYSDRL